MIMRRTDLDGAVIVITLDIQSIHLLSLYTSFFGFKRSLSDAWDKCEYDF